MWLLYAIMAAALWGLDYTIAQKLLETMKFQTLLAIEFFFAFIAMAILTLLSGTYKSDIPTLLASKQNIGLTIAMILVFIVAHVLIVLSIASKNATLASLVEISYPLFIILFSWCLFDQIHLTNGSIIGGIVIVFGVCIIYLSA